jgi:5-methylthioadenosine/S-adenosylhomocysteine deaminase
MPPPPVRSALSGRVVCLDAAFLVLPHGVVYIEQNKIAAVQDATAAPPAGFAGVAVTATGGTIYPGLIELHNHLSYNALRLWKAPQLFPDRDAWSKHNVTYQQLVAGPMRVIGEHNELVPALVRYVEAKCLVAGVTTSQGIKLVSSSAITRYYRGSLRTVEEPRDPKLAGAATHIGDVTGGQDRQKFLTTLQNHKCVLLHLCKGLPNASRQHFLILKDANGQWALAPSFVGIHCVGLLPGDFQTLQAHGGSMVWSPLSNLLLYGQTADVAAAKNAGVTIALGADWSPSGSKNLLGELKAAHAWSANNGNVFSDRDLVCMATRNAATILKWDQLLGSLEKDKYADLLVVKGTAGDAYAALVKAKETDIRLVVIGGVPRYGVSSLMNALGAAGEPLHVGGQARVFHVTPDAEDPALAHLTLADATQRLSQALQNLPQLAQQPPPHVLPTPGHPVWKLALDELAESEPAPELAAAHGPVVLQPLTLDPLTVADDDPFLTTLAAEANLPPYLAPAVKQMYL